MDGHLVERILGAGLVGEGRTRFEAEVEAVGFAEVAYHGRHLVVVGGGPAVSATPNLPQFERTGPPEPRRVPLTVEVVAPRVLRLRLGPRPVRDFGILLDPEPPGLPLDLHRLDGALVLTGGEVRLKLEADPFRLRAVAAGGPGFALAHGARGVFGQLALPPLALAGDDDGGRATVAWSLAPGERLYGLGERFAALDGRGRRVTLWATDAWGVGGEAAYKGCPLVCSSRGYAVFAHTFAPVEADLGATAGGTAALTVEDPGLDLFVFLGPDLRAALRDYTALTGRMPMPPRWAFGLWASRCRYETRAEVEETVARLDAEEIPCDVVNLDPAWLRTPALNTDFLWNEDAFPDPAGMVAGLRERGVRVCLWEVPYLAAGTALHEEARAGGYLLTGPDGAPTTEIDGAFRPDLERGIVDFTHPGAAAWWQAQHRPLLELGIAAFKTDFGEGVPPGARSAAGLDGRRLRNLYPLLYNRAVWEATAAAHGGEGLVWGRSGWAGSQRYPAQWGGDPAATVDGLAASLRGGLNWALSAPGAWSHDIGGFSGAPPSPGLYVRWAQCGLLSPLARFHGTTPREPWHFGPAALHIFRDYARLRYRLLPYLFAVAWQAHRDGLPMLRPLVLEFPRDRGSRDVDDQYLLGPALLVAPVLSERLDPVERPVYLPPDDWLDFWDGTIHPGGRVVERRYPLDRLPLFLRRGRLLPLGPPMRRVDELPTEPLTVRFAPGGDDLLELPEADGALTRLAVRSTASAATFTVEGTVPRRYAFELWATTAPRTARRGGAALDVRTDGGRATFATDRITSGEVRVAW